MAMKTSKGGSVVIGEKPQVPFPQRPGSVIRPFLEELGDELVLEVDSTGDPRHGVEVLGCLLTNMPRVASSHEGGARRRAEAIHVILGQLD